jgi:alkylation response protein AidB-like acyl-CoA dehydrogenase
MAGQSWAAADAATGLDGLRHLGSIDLTVARVVEPHLDALIIRCEAGLAPAGGRWGVFAAEAPGLALTATPDGVGWRLDGTKPWCSLAGVLDRALVTARTPDGRRLFEVDLKAAGVRVGGSAWIARGLPTVSTSDVYFDGVPSRPVGGDGWYLQRPGFAWGGIRVAAVWVGGAEAVLATLRTSLAARPEPDPIRLANLGRADVAVWSARLALADAAMHIDGDALAGAAAELLASRVRAVAADAVEVALREAGHALGPAPLGFDEEHARRVADLTIYVRQHHAERDLAALGAKLVAP